MELHTRTTEIVGGAMAGQLGVSFNLHHPLLQEIIKERVNMVVGGQGLTGGTIPGRTFDAIMATINEGMREGDGIPGLQKRVRSVFDDGLYRRLDDGRVVRILSANQRARLIARTESCWMANGAATRQVQATRMPYWKIWVTQMDDRVRPEHQELEGEKVDIDEAFSNGLEWPGEPNCRCANFFELKKEEEE